MWFLYLYYKLCNIYAAILLLTLYIYSSIVYITKTTPRDDRNGVETTYWQFEL